MKEFTRLNYFLTYKMNKNISLKILNLYGFDLFYDKVELKLKVNEKTNYYSNHSYQLFQIR